MGGMRGRAALVGLIAIATAFTANVPRYGPRRRILRNSEAKHQRQFGLA